jgi:hypothetical protein
VFAASAYDAYVEAMKRPADAKSFAVEMGGLTFTPGTWYSGTITIAAGGIVYLDGQGDPDSVFHFQAATTLLAGEGCKIVLLNGAKAENIVWATGTSFISGALTDFEGSILAGTAIILGAESKMHGCVVAQSAIVFGAENYVSVVQTGDTASPSNSPTASPSATASQSPSSSPTGSPTAAPTGCPAESMSSSPKTSAIESLETECAEDIQLFAVTGTTEYGEVPPIHILSQDRYTVTFQVLQNVFAGSVSYMYTQYHTVPNGDTGCLANANVTQSDTLTFTAECMHMTPLSIVDLWVVDAALDADLDNAQIPEWCHPSMETVLPTVQYTFQLHCVPQCVPTSAPTEAPVIASRAHTLLGKDMAF